MWLTNGRHYEGEVLERDTAADLALVKIGGSERFDALVVGNPGEARVGDGVLALGFSKISDGVELLQTDAAMNPGNSGGPLVNSNGEVMEGSSLITVTGANMRNPG